MCLGLILLVLVVKYNLRCFVVNLLLSHLRTFGGKIVWTPSFFCKKKMFFSCLCTLPRLAIRLQFLNVAFWCKSLNEAIIKPNQNSCSFLKPVLQRFYPVSPNYRTVFDKQECAILRKYLKITFFSLKNLKHKMHFVGLPFFFMSWWVSQIQNCLCMYSVLPI